VRQTKEAGIMAGRTRIARDLIAGAAMAIGMTLLVSGGHVAASTPNDVSYWCAQGGVKYEPVATPFVVPDPPDGYVWTLLVVKSGSVDVGHGPGNDAPIVNPIVGQSYSHSTGKSNSHVILCMEPDTTTTVPGSTATTTVPGSTATTTVPGATATTQPGATATTTVPGSTATTQPGATATTQPGATTTAAVGQAGPTSSVAQSSGAAGSITYPAGSTLPATGAGDLSRNLTLIALMLIGVGAVMVRLRSKPTG
jgi:LPXTG-motif cell wall-anchored protein